MSNDLSLSIKELEHCNIRLGTFVEDSEQTIGKEPRTNIKLTLDLTLRIANVFITLRRVNGANLPSSLAITAVLVIQK